MALLPDRTFPRLSDLLREIPLKHTRYVLQDEERSYAKEEIIAAVQCLGRALKNQGVHKGDKIAVLCGAGAAQILGMFSVWSIGAIYVPISSENTPARVRYILDDCEIGHVIVSDETLITKFGLTNVRILNVSQILAGGASANEPLAVESTSSFDTAYICYTSGSTGKPKGVLISHGSVSRLLDSTAEMFSWISDHDIHLQTLDYSFDISIWNVLIWLLNGGTLVSAGFGTNVVKLVSLIVKYRPTFICNAAPTYALMMASKTLWQRYDLSSPTTILTVASYCLPKTALDVLQAFPGARLFNCYGPTETTVYCCWTEITPESIDMSLPLSIGHVMPGNRAWLYDGAVPRPGEEVADGTQLELCISGDHVCQGYWNAPPLTKEKFLTSPQGERVYRTGDLVSRRGEEYYYWGRLDDTIKIKGYRVNLGEIEHCLGASESVSACVVLEILTGAYQSELVALYIPKQGIPLGDAELAANLKSLCEKELPRYMVPSKFFGVKQWPMTASGKIDRLALRKEWTPRAG